MSDKPDLTGDSLRDVYEIGSTIEGLSQILQELDIAREFGDEPPEWQKPCHTAALIAAIKHLARGALNEIEVVQQRRAGGDS